MGSHSPSRWNQVADQLNSEIEGAERTGKQCRERWLNHLSPEINKFQWSSQQDQLLGNAIYSQGSRWSQISKALKGRSDNSIKNHYYSTVRKSIRALNKKWHSLQKKGCINQKRLLCLLMDDCFDVSHQRREKEEFQRLIKLLRRDLFNEKEFQSERCVQIIENIRLLQQLSSHRGQPSEVSFCSVPKELELPPTPFYYFNQFVPVIYF